MSHTPHGLQAEFPEDAAILHLLKMDSEPFRTLSSRYQNVNAAIHRIDIGLEPASDVRSEDLKKERLHLLDQISVLIKNIEEDT